MMKTKFSRSVPVSRNENMSCAKNTKATKLCKRKVHFHYKNIFLNHVHFSPCCKTPHICCQQSRRCVCSQHYSDQTMLLEMREKQGGEEEKVGK